jgi:hypothetical protein
MSAILITNPGIYNKLIFIIRNYTFPHINTVPILFAAAYRQIVYC